jgi:hypothetical protein
VTGFTIAKFLSDDPRALGAVLLLVVAVLVLYRMVK